MGYRIRWYELALGLFIIPGMVLIANTTAASMLTGFWVGLLSALLASLFAILNKKLITQADPLTITFVELSSAWVFLSAVVAVYFSVSGKQPFFPSTADWAYLLILSLLCTTLAYVLSLRSLRYLSAFASNLTVNLEPVYGIALAVLILKEDRELTPNFYAGVVIILIAVFSSPFLRKRFSKKDWTARKVLR